jgi:predicted nuclease of predicted toxin-antitoxin system
LRAEFPGSSHVRNVGLLGADDSAVWAHARGDHFAIVSKDNDFRQRSFLEGAPPKIIWLSVGNAGTVAIADLLRREHGRILAFEADTESSLLVLTL